jgi:hypothetical protein
MNLLGPSSALWRRMVTTRWSVGLSVGALFVVGCAADATMNPVDAGALVDATPFDASPPPDPASWRTAATLHYARARATATRLADGRVLVVGGDDDNLAMLASAEIYDPAQDRWHDAAPLPAPRAYHSATLLPDGRVLVAGGGPGSEISIPNGDGDLASALLYDPQADSWSTTGAMKGARAGHQAARLTDGRVLVTGGGAGVGYSCAQIHPNCTIANSIATTEIYDPSQGSWSSAGDLAQARLAFTLTALPSGALLAAGGGAENHSLASAERFDPTTGKWTTVAPMGEDRLYHSAVLLGDGKLLTVGGKIANVAPITDVELFDEMSGKWNKGALLSEPRTGAIPVLLPSGRALIVGGNDQLGNPFLDDAEIYDDAAKKWSPIGALDEGRYSHTATLLTDGTVLVVGGVGLFGTLDSCERSK